MHCKNKVVIVAKYLVTTVAGLLTMQILWTQCWKGIHAVGAHTWVNSHKMFYKHHILW